MQCDVCSKSLEEQKFTRFVVRDDQVFRQVTICTKCSSSVMRHSSGCIVTSREAFSMPTLVFDGEDSVAQAIAVEQGWKLPAEVEKDEDHVIINKHWEHAINNYVYLRGGTWKYSGEDKKICFQHSCRVIRDYYGDYYSNEMK